MTWAWRALAVLTAAALITAAFALASLEQPPQHLGRIVTPLGPTPTTR